MNSDHTNPYFSYKLYKELTSDHQIAIRLFIDNVAILAIESCLIDELPGIFSPDIVSGMDDALLERLAAESEDIQTDRKSLKEKLEVLQLGLKTCSRYLGPDSGTKLRSFSRIIVRGPT